LKRLLSEFTTLGALPRPQLSDCSARELCSDLGTLYGRESAEGRLAISPLDGDPAWRADRGLVRQALVNLVKNGLEATAPAGHVRVSVRSDSGAIEWSVTDDGPGLDAAQRSQLFVPEFTTKPEGSGLGLTIVERIASDHGGTIRVESEPGRGTTFRLRLPLTGGG
jgi:signal transduction histidine kinase